MRLLIYELITAGGLGDDVPDSLRREGAAMVSAAVQDFERIAGVEALTLVAQGGTPLGRHCRLIAPRDEAKAFGDLAASADAALVIAPEFDDLLATRSQEALDAGCRLLGSRPDAIRLAGDKLRLAEILRERSIPTPFTSAARSDLPEDTRIPCVLKPRHGAGSQATFLVRSRADWPGAYMQAAGEWPRGDFVIQPFAPGQAVSVACLMGARQTIATPGATQRLSDDGRFRYLGGRTPLPRELRERALSLACKALDVVCGLAGYVGVDLILGDAADGSEDVVIEMNPRLTTSYIGLRCLTADNWAEIWLRLWRGDAVTPPQGREEEVEFYPDGRTLLAVPGSQASFGTRRPPASAQR